MKDIQISTDNKNSISVFSSLFWILSDTIVIAKRELKRISRNPDEMLASTLVPIVFFLMFRYVFGGAISVPGNDYTNYLVPGILTLACFLGSASTGLGLCTDLESGLIDRFISLPMARSAVLSGRILATLIRSLFIIIFVFVFSKLIGYRTEGTIVNYLVAIGLLMLGILTFSWFFGLLALLIRKLESFSAMAPLFAMLLVYFSSGFAPTKTMPFVLRIYAENQPVSLLIDSIRGLLQNQVDSQVIMKTLVWYIILLVVIVPLTIRVYKHITS
jgi:ABC transporter DrrB family efflux protein